MRRREHFNGLPRALLLALIASVAAGAHADDPSLQGTFVNEQQSAKTIETAVEAAVAKNEWVLYVMTWASQLSGYPFPDKLPEVQLKSEGWFSHRVCEDHLPCPIFGLYEDADIVFLREDLTDAAKDHVAVHEFVHYLQHRSGRFDLKSCLDSDKREQEAFRVQSRFVAEVQNGFTKFLFHHPACKPET